MGVKKAKKKSKLCSLCEKKVIHIRTDKQNNDRSYVYVDGAGKQWKGTKCPPCLLSSRRKYKNKHSEKRRREMGKPTRRESKDKRIQKSLKYEDKAKDFILKYGIETKLLKIKPNDLVFLKQSTMNGTDLIFKQKSNKKKVKVEVKTVQKVKGCRSLRIDAVHKKERKDDVIAIVYKKKRIHFEDMMEHLSNCNPCGTRTVTKLFPRKKESYIMGCDPGQDGAFVLLNKDNGKIVKMFRVPTLQGKTKTKEPDWHAVDDFIKKYKKRIVHAFLEKPNTGGAFSGRTQTLSLGKSIGTFKTMLISNELRFTMLAPTAWQKVMFQGIPVIAHPKKETPEEKKKRQKAKRKKPAPKVKDNKAMALEAAKRLFPKKTFIPEGCRVPFDGWVDAALIGLHGLWQINGKELEK